MKHTTNKVLENVKVAEGIYKLRVSGNFEAKPGQFYMLKAWIGDPLLGRPISVHDVKENEITFLYQVKGVGTQKINALRKEDSIDLTGPLGNGFNLEDIKGKVAIVSGGIGIAPMNYLIKSMDKAKVDLYAGFRNEVYGLEEIKEKVDKVFITTEDGSKGEKGYITKIFNPDKYDLVVSCGPEVLMYKIIKMCNERNKKVYVSMEKKMACGIGACLVCTCKTKDGNKRSCKDGPVFLGSELILND